MMLIEMIEEDRFNTIMKRHIEEVLLYLLESGRPFGLLCQLKYVTFDPPLPEELAQNLQDVTLFMIAGYTFESFEIEEERLFFEAGFGPQNFGTVVTLPLLATLQILVEDTPILINLAHPRLHTRTKAQTKGLQSSLESFLSNPENQKFLKKR